MICICLCERPEQLLFTCDGHAGAGEPGKDIVCAAVSTTVELMKRILVPTVCEEKNGSVKLELDRPPRPKDARAAYLWWSGRRDDWGVFRQFFCDLAGQYPDKITVNLL